MSGQWIDIEANDGVSFSGYLSTPRGGKGPGIVLCQEIFGVNPYIQSVADYYAEEGYVVLAPDLFWRINPGIQLGYTEKDFERAFQLFGQFDTDQGMNDISASVKTLRSRPEVVGKV
ncbi:MAG TPA: carboxymethylenebutenolidase, partial [Betaproteobacteria bacterium]|nr:carboxymethylenebutenolidase [Betaproteobacteria bacterium]